jgi:hypothetical protein
VGNRPEAGHPKLEPTRDGPSDTLPISRQVGELTPPIIAGLSNRAKVADNPSTNRGY